MPILLPRDAQRGPWLVDTGDGIRFRDPIFRVGKYARILQRLRTAGVIGDADIARPAPDTRVTRADLERVHTADYLDRLRSYALGTPAYAVPELDVPCHAGTLWAVEHVVAGTCLALDLALANGRGAFHLGGGFHHAFADHGEGFCLIHDVAVALRRALASGRIARALVLDLDAHQGNGTASLFAADPRVRTVSLHNASIYPLVAPGGAPAVRAPSDVDVDLAAGTDNRTYLAALDQQLDAAFAPDRGAGAKQPFDLMVLLAGADPFHDDMLGGLALTRDGLTERTRRALAAARQAGVPALVVLAGGYPRSMDDMIDIHAAAVTTARDVWFAAASP